MTKPLRKVRFLENYGNKLLYDTEFHGPWTLTELTLSEPERKTNIVEIPGRDGEIDLAPALTNGEPRYKNRELTLRFECSVGSKDERTALIRDLMSRIAGKYCWIVLPDDPTHHLTGYVDVRPEYNDLNHAAVEITSRVAPYFEANYPVKYDVEAVTRRESLIIKNSGSKRVVPVVSAYATAPNMPHIMIIYGAGSTTMMLEDYTSRQLEALAMDYMQEHIIWYAGAGHLVITWREAHL